MADTFPTLAPTAAPTVPLLGSTPDQVVADAKSNTAVIAPTTGVAQTYNASTGIVDANKTVAGQLDSILASDSPYINRAQTIAQQKANSRGLINSTMAAQAGTAAAIDAAMPIAQADAQTNFANQTQNLNFTNSAAQYNTGAINAMTNANMGAVNTAASQNAGFTNDSIQRQLQRNQDLIINSLGITAQSADKSYASTMDAIARVQASDMNIADKDAAMTDIMGLQIDHANVLQRITGDNGFAQYL